MFAWLHVHLLKTIIWYIHPYKEWLLAVRKYSTFDGTDCYAIKITEKSKWCYFHS